MHLSYVHACRIVAYHAQSYVDVSSTSVYYITQEFRFSMHIVCYSHTHQAWHCCATTYVGIRWTKDKAMYSQFISTYDSP